MPEPITIGAVVLSIASSVLASLISHVVIKTGEKTLSKRRGIEPVDPTSKDRFSKYEIEKLVEKEVDTLISNGKF